MAISRRLQFFSIISVIVGLFAYYGPALLLLFPTFFAGLAPFFSSYLDLFKLNIPYLAPFNTIPSPSSSCPPHTYTVQLISHNPLLIYIHNFVSPREAKLIIQSGEPILERSPITGDGSRQEARTSSSAPLAGDDETVQCVLARAEEMLGGIMPVQPAGEMGVAQMVSYGTGEKFDLHTDWFSRPKVTDEDLESGRRRLYNRLATFFVVLEAEGVEEKSGETWFPFIDGEEKEGLWRKHEDGGVAVKPIAGNAVFWVNLLQENGTLTGDRRTLHAGLPVRGEGARKKAMNIWPRVFFGPDA
ncbi:hypothetical protein QBC43DRAFT_55793 [Cladorrhinum sp. PSN259]|nr:hypothetical protein QBC43DRAFT_55793 [Cladorrhinum sp. PSN259]